VSVGVISETTFFKCTSLPVLLSEIPEIESFLLYHYVPQFCTVMSFSNMVLSVLSLRPLLCWDVTWRRLVVGYRRFGITYRFYL
jgi:hypothetical protein